MLNDEQLRDRLDHQPSKRRITEADLTERVRAVHFDRVAEGTMTTCVITMSNGFQVLGHSACVDPDNYDQQVGERIAYDVAFRQLWALEGYALKERLAGR